MKSRVLVLAREFLAGFARNDYKFRKISAQMNRWGAALLGSRTLARRAFQTPTGALLPLSSRCNMKCVDCVYGTFLTGGGKQTHLEFDLQRITELYDNPLFRTVCRVTLAGGEPLLCKEYREIIEFFSRKGVLVTLSTNGLLLTEEVLRELYRSGMVTLNISIYRDNKMGRVSNLEKIREIFQFARRNNVDTEKIWLIYHGDKLEEYKKAYDFALSVQARHLMFQRTAVTEKLRGSPDFDESETGAEEFIAGYYRLCHQLEAEGKISLHYNRPNRRPGKPYIGGICPCPAIMMNYLVFSPSGELSPCCILPPSEKYGTIDNPAKVMEFKQRMLEDHVPAVCNGCPMLNTVYY